MRTGATAPVQTGTVGLSTAGWAGVGLVLLYLLSVATPAGQQLDDATMQWTAAAVTSTGWAKTLLTAVSAGRMLLAGAALAIVTAAIRGLRTAARSTLSGGVVLLGAEVLKHSLIRPGFSVQALANSFPSGHVAAVAGLSLALLLATPPGRWRRAAMVGATGAVALTGFATVVLQWHRPSDVFGSILLGVVVGVFASRQTRQAAMGCGASILCPPRQRQALTAAEPLRCAPRRRTDDNRSAQSLSQPPHRCANDAAQVAQAY